MKKWWKNWIIILSLIAAMFTIGNSFYGWFTPKEEIKPGYICADGTIVSEPENCPRCNDDGECQETEDCDCKDCEDQVRCVIQRIGEKEYLLLLNNPKKIEGKRVKVTEITQKGIVTVDIEDEVRTIRTTKQEEIINGLRITTQEIIYNNLKPKESMVIIKIEKYKPEKNEYLLKLDEIMLIEGMQIKLSKAVQSKPNYILIDVGNNPDEKIKEKADKTINDLKITLVKTYPQKIQSESYAIIKAERI